MTGDLTYVNPGTMGLHRNDDLTNSSALNPSQNAKSQRYQPWGLNKQLAGLSGVDTNAYNLTYKDPQIWSSDYWDFPTYQYPTVGWIGRVHRGTPWQTIYLKDVDLLKVYPWGTNTWANWTGDTQQDYYTGQYVESSRSAPVEDRLLFDLFTTRFNDNSARGRLPVNEGAGLSDGGLAAWSALFSGMVVLSNSAAAVSATTPLTNNNLIINPVGSTGTNSPLWQIVNGASGINATRTNTGLFPFQSFVHVGDILATPALTVNSPFINLGNSQYPWLQQMKYGINDELYEWLPQQMMGLVRDSEPRYVLYCVGQTLKPATGGEVVGGSFSQLITNYQVVAESDVRVVLRVVNANTAQPHVVVESYNVLPPN
jgi:hypothetical protein